MDESQQFHKTLESKLSDSQQSQQTLESQLREFQESQQMLESQLRESQHNHRESFEIIRSKEQIIQQLKSELDKNDELIAELVASTQERTESLSNKFVDMNIDQSVSEGTLAVTPGVQLPQPVNANSQNICEIVKTVKKPEAVMKSFRRCCDLSFIHKSIFAKVNEFEVGWSERLCYHDNKLYLPHFDENTISVYTTEGELTDTLTLRDIDGPRSLHPVNGGHFMLAAWTGLYVIDERGGVRSKVLEGNFIDVHCDGDICAVIENVLPKHKIYILSNVAPYREQSQFDLSHEISLSVHVTNGRVYVSDGHTHQVTEYSVQGQQLAVYGWGERENLEPGLLWSPYICMLDDSRRVFVADRDHGRLQVVSLGTGEWWVVSLAEVQEVCDALVIGDKLFVLSYYSFTIYNISN